MSGRYALPIGAAVAAIAAAALSWIVYQSPAFALMLASLPFCL